MVTAEEFSRLVSGIYQSAIDPDNWVRALTEVRRAVDATGGGLSIPEGASRRMINVDVPAEAMTCYGEYYQYIDYVLTAVESGPVGLTRSGSELVGLEEGSEFHADWMRPYGMDDGLFVRLTGGTAPISIVLASPKRSDAFDSRERVHLLDTLIPHFQQALRTQHHIERLVEDHDQLVPVVDRIRHGIAVLGPDQRVMHLNAAADHILRARDGLQLRCGRIEATCTATNAELSRNIGRALAQDAVDVWGGSFRCPRPSVLRPYVVHVFPVDRKSDDACPTARRTAVPRRVAVAIVDPELQCEPPGPLLRRLCGLTAAEADVAVRIARGADLKDIADDLSVTLATVRTHLHHVYDKTDTHRQAELVRLLLSLAI